MHEYKRFAIINAGIIVDRTRGLLFPFCLVGLLDKIDEMIVIEDRDRRLCMPRFSYRNKCFSDERMSKRIHDESVILASGQRVCNTVIRNSLGSSYERLTDSADRWKMIIHTRSCILIKSRITGLDKKER